MDYGYRYIISAQNPNTSRWKMLAKFVCKFHGRHSNVRVSPKVEILSFFIENNQNEFTRMLLMKSKHFEKLDNGE